LEYGFIDPIDQLINVFKAAIQDGQVSIRGTRRLFVALLYFANCIGVLARRGLVFKIFDRFDSGV
jgi:hypothetical protein